MSELKTLQDFETNDDSVDLLMEVRAEAVKWVKAFRLKMELVDYIKQDPFYKPKPINSLSDQEKRILENIYEPSFEYGMIRFFNIKEEDLK